MALAICRIMAGVRMWVRNLWCLMNRFSLAALVLGLLSCGLVAGCAKQSSSSPTVAASPATVTTIATASSPASNQKAEKKRRVVVVPEAEVEFEVPADWTQDEKGTMLTPARELIITADSSDKEMPVKQNIELLAGELSNHSKRNQIGEPVEFQQNGLTIASVDAAIDMGRGLANWKFFLIRGGKKRCFIMILARHPQGLARYQEDLAALIASIRPQAPQKAGSPSLP